MDSERLLVSLRSIVKEFSGVRANDGVDLNLREGEIHALLGENGAGKTTLMKVLAGFYRPDEGEIRIRGARLVLRSPRDAIERGIGMVHQHFRLVDRFTVAENVTLGWHTPRAIIRRPSLEREIGALSAQYGIQVDPARPVWQLSVGEQQRVELLKNLYRGAEILILDEPTAVLTPQETEVLFESLRQMAAGGRGILFITHKLAEVTAVADRVTVLRRGRDVATVTVAETTEAELARKMIGRDFLPQESRPNTRPGELVLRLEGLEVDDDRGLRALRGLDLELHSGELLGIAGVAGNGQRELAEALVGLRPARGGRVLLHGRDVSSWTVRRRIEAGVGYCPEDRLRHGVAPTLSIADNLVSKSIRRPPIRRGFLLDRRAARRSAAELIHRFDVRGASIDAPAGSLSGGNLQKLVLARELSPEPAVLVAAQPTRGLDLAAAVGMRQLLLEQCQRGAAVLLISEDLDELVALSHRIAVIYEGRVMGTFDAAEVDEQRLGLLMAGRRA